jgi:hypothetical protein
MNKQPNVVVKNIFLHDFNTQHAYKFTYITGIHKFHTIHIILYPEVICKNYIFHECISIILIQGSVTWGHLQHEHSYNSVFNYVQD